MGECSILRERLAYEVMSTPPVTVGLDASVSEASRVMYTNNVGSVVVVDGEGRVAGILTRRDILRLVATGEAARDPKVESVMAAGVVTAGERDSLSSILSRMRAAGVKHVVVVDEGERPVGVVSMWDILGLLAGECIEDL